MEEAKGKVCVTGASGYIASWLVKQLLRSGYQVIGTVRDPGNEKKVGHLLKLEGAKERLELMTAELLEEGSFDEAIMGCQGVFHTASPVTMKDASDPKKEILETAVMGTLNVLGSCKKNPFLRRVVLTSSSSAMTCRSDWDPKIPMDESSWSNVQICESYQTWYPLSKTQAEKSAWEFCKDNNIDLVTILPSFVMGPNLSHDLCATASDVLHLLKGEKEKFQFYGRLGYVHVDDVASCHILVYEHKAANGRYLCSSTILDNNELVSIISSRYPSLPVPDRFQKQDRPNYDLNTSKIRSLGFNFRPIEDMLDDCIKSLVEQGHLSLQSDNLRTLS